MRLWTTGFMLVLMGCVSGCGKPKLEVDSKFDLSTDFSHTSTLEPIKSEQQIQVNGTATGGSVDVFIYLEKNKTKAQTEIATRKFTPVILEKQLNADAISLVAIIPANEGAVVQVNRIGNKGASVQLKITNK
jgi:hypothetical protein